MYKVKVDAPIFESLLHLEMLEGVVLNGVDEGLRHRVDRELCENLNEYKAKEKLNSQLLSLYKILLVTLAGWVRGVC